MFGLDPREIEERSERSRVNKERSDHYAGFNYASLIDQTTESWSPFSRNLARRLGRNISLGPSRMPSFAWPRSHLTDRIKKPVARRDEHACSREVRAYPRANGRKDSARGEGAGVGGVQTRAIWGLGQFKACVNRATRCIRTWDRVWLDFPLAITRDAQPRSWKIQKARFLLKFCRETGSRGLKITASFENSLFKIFLAVSEGTFPDLNFIQASR